MTLHNLLKYKNHPNIVIYNCENFQIDEYIPSIKKFKYIINTIEFIKTDKYFLFHNLVDQSKLKTILYNLLKTSELNYYIFTNVLKKYQVIISNLIYRFPSHKFIVIAKNYSDISILANKCVAIRMKPIDSYTRYNKLKKDVSINTFIKNINFSDSYISKNPKFLFMDDLLDFIIKNKSIKIMKQLSYYLVSSNIPLFIIYRGLLEKLLLNNKLTHNKRYELVKLVTETDYLYTKSYYKMIYLEYLFIGIMNIIENKKIC